VKRHVRCKRKKAERKKTGHPTWHSEHAALHCMAGTHVCDTREQTRAECRAEQIAKSGVVG
jgi:hypothetical protein